MNYIKAIITASILLLLFCSFSFFYPDKKEVFSANSDSRLHSDSIDILHYDIHLDITDFTNKQIAGYTDIKLLARISGLDVISLDLLRLTIDSILFNGKPVSTFSYNDTLIKIFCSPLSVSDTVNLSVYYHGKPVTDASWGGFYFTPSYAFNLGVAFVDYPHCYGRVWFPCIDDFIDRATFDFYITTQFTHRAVCTGSLVSQQDNGNNTKTWRWNMRDTIPTYLAGIAVGGYISVTDTFAGMNGKIPINIYVLPADSSKAVASFKNSKSILSGYESCFGPYVWEKVGYVATSQGAMEHASLVSYPNSCINGNLTYEYLYAHELSHHWFGDLMTCRTDYDMWINEGWATFCESVYKEKLYGEGAYKTYTRNKHYTVLRNLHHNEGYLAIYGIPLDMTYCNTVYDKGAGVVHTLRGYLGDSLFFSAVKSMLSAYAFKDISSVEMRDYLSSYTGIDMTGFFDFWVFHPGFTDYSVDSFLVMKNGSDYLTTVFIRQKLKGATQFPYSNRVPVAFMDTNWNRHDDTLFFNGQYGSQTFTLPFHPTLVMTDPEEKLADATTDCYQIINKKVTSLTFDKTFFSLTVSSITDSILIRAEHHWVAADTFKTPVPCLFVSDIRYWKIDGILSGGLKASCKFGYENTNTLDADFITNSTDSLVLLYRRDASCDWSIIPFTKQSAFLVTDSLRLGEYALGIWDWNKWNKIHPVTKKNNNLIAVFPNPSEDSFNIIFHITNESRLHIFDSTGKMVFSVKVQPQESSFLWKPENLSSGIYFIRLDDGTGYISNQKVVYR